MKPKNIVMPHPNPVNSNMAPLIIGIGGGHSGSGKTTVACRLLEALKGWGALKYTPTYIYSSVTDNQTELRQGGKDTGRYLEAGASRVIWVQAPKDELQEPLSLGINHLAGLVGIVVEGNSAIELLKPDIVIFNSGEPDKFKDKAGRVLAMADLVIFDKTLPDNIPKGTKSFQRDDWERILRHVMDIMDERRHRETIGREDN